MSDNFDQTATTPPVCFTCLKWIDGGDLSEPNVYVNRCNGGGDPAVLYKRFLHFIKEHLDYATEIFPALTQAFLNRKTTVVTAVKLEEGEEGTVTAPPVPVFCPKCEGIVKRICDSFDALCEANNRLSDNVGMLGSIMKTSSKLTSRGGQWKQTQLQTIGKQLEVEGGTLAVYGMRRELAQKCKLKSTNKLNPFNYESGNNAPSMEAEDDGIIHLSNQISIVPILTPFPAPAAAPQERDNYEAHHDVKLFSSCNSNSANDCHDDSIHEWNLARMRERIQTKLPIDIEVIEVDENFMEQAGIPLKQEVAGNDLMMTGIGMGIRFPPDLIIKEVKVKAEYDYGTDTTTTYPQTAGASGGAATSHQQGNENAFLPSTAPPFPSTSTATTTASAAPTPIKNDATMTSAIACPPPTNFPEFVEYFRAHRIQLGMTQEAVANQLSDLYGTEVIAFNRATISRFENGHLSSKSMARVVPLCRKWIMGVQAEDKDVDKKEENVNSYNSLVRRSKGRRQRRTHFTGERLEYLKNYFEQNQIPDASEVRAIGQLLNLDKKVIYNWFHGRRKKERKMIADGDAQNHPQPQQQNAIAMPFMNPDPNAPALELLEPPVIESNELVHLNQE